MDAPTFQKFLSEITGDQATTEALQIFFGRHLLGSAGGSFDLDGTLSQPGQDAGSFGA